MGKVIVTTPRIDTTLFRPAAHKWLGLVAAVGRLSPEKNIAALISAVAGLSWPRLWIAGDGPLHVELYALVESVGDNRIVLLGNVPNDLVAVILSKSEYFVLPSLYDQAPKALWEAMACACTCIVSAQVGVVEDGVTGFLCNPTAEGIRVALERSKNDPKRDRIAQEARRWVKKAQVVSQAGITQRSGYGAIGAPNRENARAED